MTRIARAGFCAALAAALLSVPLAAGAATITIVNVDGAGEGFNDPTVVAPVGGNPGTTVGQQRLNVFTQAASIWGSILPSAVVITVDAKFDPLTCTSTSGTLGSAGPRTIHSSFSGQEFANYWYHQALANKEHGTDLAPATSDIQATFNASVGQTGCLDGGFWYYGFDHNQGIGFDLLAVVLHELAHGLGFSTTTSASNGAFLNGPPALPGLWDRFLFDRTAGLHWDQMSAAQRTASAINTGNLVWDGTAVTVKAPQLLQLPRLLVNTPPGIAGTYAVGTAEFGAKLTSGGVTGNMVLATDGVGSTNDGCEAFTNAGAVNGNIAVVDRGTCAFTVKATNAFNAGATALVIANNTTGVFDMSGSAPGVTIPTVMISQADGNTIKAQLGGGVNATAGLDPNVHPGTALDAGKFRALMYAPNPVAPGSSVSHFDISASPNALMEPQINGDLTDDVDLTRYLFEDIGWLPRTTTGVPGVPVAGTGIDLRGAPNPFRTTTSMRVNLPAPGMVELTVLDIGGRSVRQLARSWMPAGSHVIAWDGTDREGHEVPAGVYLTRLRVGNANITQRIVRMQ
jgi:hypothetical protein